MLFRSPDAWACKFLDRLGEEIKKRKFDGRNAVDPIRFATSSGHGIGKSTLSAWLIKFILDTRPFSMGIATATTADQLRIKTWGELGKWHRISLTQHWFDYNTGRGSMSLVNKRFPERWRCDGQTAKEENSESFAGLHAVNSTPFYLFDEASGVPNKIYEVREGGATDGEPMRFDFGNPTRNTGYFYENCVGKFSKRYIVTKIDSRDVAITNKALFEEWAEDYGEDSDFFKVRVRGEFPSAGDIQFISGDDVTAAQNREVPPQSINRHAPLLIGVDVARFGDDESVIWPRVGDDARSWPIKRMKGVDTVRLVGEIINIIREFEKLGVKCDGLFVDGGNTGGAVVDMLRGLNYDPFEVQFGAKAVDGKTYRLAMDEIWGKMKEHIKTRLVLPRRNEKNSQELYDQLTQRQFGYTLKQQIALESKTDMKARGISSPDIPDALAVTYFQEVASRAPDDLANQQGAKVIDDYDYLADKVH